MKIKSENPFIPELVKSYLEIKAETELKKKQEEAKVKEEKAHEAIMSQTRPQMTDQQFMFLNALAGDITVELLVYVPETKWALQNPFFDGIKYNGPVMQAPYNVFNFNGPSLWPGQPKPAAEKKEASDK